MRAWPLVAALALLVMAAAAAGPAPQASGVLDFSAEERARIALHGPWPPAPTVPASTAAPPVPGQGNDPGNRVAGRPAAIALGQRLFMDRRLSPNGFACATCHDPQQGLQDGRPSARLGRNTPGLMDVGLQRWFGWDGAADSLWAASLAPLTAADELAATPAHAAELLAQDGSLATLYREAFGPSPGQGPPAADGVLLVNLAKALAAWQATLVSPPTPFDDFREALLSGDAAKAARYPLAAQRGLKLFIGPARCVLCHAGPRFSNGEFADIGRPFFAAGGADPGRWGGLKRLLASPYNRLGGFSDAPADHPSATGTRHVLLEPRHFGEFKVPGLRGLVATAPYFHDGSAATLEAVVQHYSELDEGRLHADGVRLLRALRLTAQQSADLVAFLRSLSAAAPSPSAPLPLPRPTAQRDNRAP